MTTEVTAPDGGTQVLDPAAITPPAATPATPPAPATPPPPAAETLDAPAAVDPADAGFTYEATGDPGLDIALEFIGKAGFGIDHPAVLEAIDGKFDKLEAHLSALGDKATGWERYIGLAKTAYERTATDTAARQTAITSAVTEIAGGAEQWATIKDWASKEADPAEKKEINAMLAAGPLQARAAAFLLSDLYRNAGGTTVTPANPVTPNAPAGGHSDNGTLSPAAYNQAVRDLRVELGGRDLDTSPKYAALQARRSAWQG